jgi:hypothetical protein
MATYTPKTWQSREFIKTSDLNHIEQGISVATAAIATSASIDNNGLITFKNSANNSLFTLQLPLYNESYTLEENL